MPEMYVKYRGDTAVEYLFGEDWEAQAMAMDDRKGFQTEGEAVVNWAKRKGYSFWIYHRLPKVEERVLCCTQTKAGRKNIVVGYYDGGRWVCGTNSNVIAWMPLPEPPEDPELDSCPLCGGRVYIGLSSYGKYPFAVYHFNSKNCKLDPLYIDDWKSSYPHEIKSVKDMAEIWNMAAQEVRSQKKANN